MIESQSQQLLKPKSIASPVLKQTRTWLLSGAAAAGMLALAASQNIGNAVAAEALFSPAATAAARAPAQAAAMPGFTELVAAVKPAVVSVRVKAKAGAEIAAAQTVPDPFKGTPFERFFRNMPGQGQGYGRGDGNNDMPEPRGNGGAGRVVQAQGSGFLVSADGYIITNNHVVDHAMKVEVVTDAGATFQAKVIGTDAKTDVALIKVEGQADFPYVRLASTPAKIGEWVVAMGNPFGLGGTVTAGIVSAEGRDIGSGPYDDFIQIDAPVNRGNSGGPTFNLRGEVIGVNTAIYSPSGGSVGIAFDIPASTLASIVPQLQQHGHVTRGWLGVQIQPVTSAIASSLGMSKAHGVLVTEPQSDSPAAKAGLQSGDVITSLDGVEIKDPRDLARRVAELGPNRTVNIAVLRDGRDQTMQLTLGELKDKAAVTASKMPSPKAVPTVSGLGLSVEPAREIDGAGNKGLVVTEVASDGKAADAGLRTGDILLKAGSMELTSPQDLMDALVAARKSGRDGALVLYKRNNTEAYMALPTQTG